MFGVQRFQRCFHLVFELAGVRDQRISGARKLTFKLQ